MARIGAVQNAACAPQSLLALFLFTMVVKTSSLSLLFAFLPVLAVRTVSFLGGNNLCTQDDSPEYVNALCAVNPWRNCSNICLYGKNSYSLSIVVRHILTIGLLGAGWNGLLPRVTRCPDGKYCCDSDKNCCEKGEGIELDGKGNIVGSTKSQSTPSPTQTISSPTSGLPANVTSFPTDTSKPISSVSSTALPLAAKIGIGVAIAFSVLSCLILSAIYLQRRRRSRRKSIEVAEPALKPEVPPPDYTKSFSPQEMSNSPIPQQFEMPDYSMRVELAGDVPPYPELYGSRRASTMSSIRRGSRI
ncbi:predicted protein [Uncinocarpus reesii 1704]|uniref:Mid2 domain-containing protein n=1 Tax=Uncinocarpus reesii (strain UAMH 1704) TaxID=336963 RepID=C4JJS5_UNCRE|nr:uncharacterized protein UREG_01882 [Uncinocarpus reesii 1704]EEP77033.1 predicted protein [Uncinocarpus reesii 1704]